MLKASFSHWTASLPRGWVRDGHIQASFTYNFRIGNKVLPPNWRQVIEDYCRCAIIRCGVYIFTRFFTATYIVELLIYPDSFLQQKIELTQRLSYFFVVLHTK